MQRKCLYCKCLYINVFIFHLCFFFLLCPMLCSIVAGWWVGSCKVVELLCKVLVVWDVLVFVGMVLWRILGAGMVDLQYVVLECVAASGICNCWVSLVLKRLNLCCTSVVMVLECVVYSGSCSWIVSLMLVVWVIRVLSLSVDSVDELGLVVFTGL